jgi:DNA-binding HxlR family transcriptional regulator
MDMTEIPPRPAQLPGCQKSNEVMSRIGDRWTVIVVTELSRGPLRFNELKREVSGISQQMLVRTLKALEREGIVVRTVFSTVPIQVTYELTALGRSLSEALTALVIWVVEHMNDLEQARVSYDGKLDHRKPHS